MTSAEKHILVVDDVPMTRDVWAKSITDLLGYQATGVATAADALKVAESVHFDAFLVDVLLLKDVDSADGRYADGCELLDQLHHTYPGRPVMMFSNERKPYWVWDLVKRHSAAGFLKKDIQVDDFRFAIESLMRLGTFVTPNDKKMIELIDRLHVSTPMKEETLKLLLAGKQDGEIASTRNIRPGTVSQTLEAMRRDFAEALELDPPLTTRELISKAKELGFFPE